MTAPEPEILAHVLRVERRAAGGSFVAIRFDPSALAGAAAKPPVERRFLPRTVIGVPIAVRAPSCPWPEETMTLDLSADGLSFVTPRIYKVGDTLKVAMGLGVTPAGWGSHGEVAARVVRVAPASVSPAPESSAMLDSRSWSDGSASSGSPQLESSVSPVSASNDQLVALRRIP
jgi:hypothetical protein